MTMTSAIEKKKTESSEECLCPTGECEIGMIGLGVMGRNFLLNIADHGYSVAGYDKEQNQVDALADEKDGQEIYPAGNLKDFLDSLRAPRAILMLVPAGKAVDSVIEDLEDHLDPGDVLIDAGNSYFKDTNLRARRLSERGIHYLGVGVSGGEEGARHGPSIMPGGPKEAYDRVRPLLKAAAAHVDGEPCVAYLGPGSSGHFVKMVHNGIEYGIMQILAESYHLMKGGVGMSDGELHEVYKEWNEGELESYLIEITGRIFARKDKKTGNSMIDVILDVAKQKGTGMWTSQTAMELQVPTPTIDTAVAARNLSSHEQERERATQTLKRTPMHFRSDKAAILRQIREAVLTGMIVAYAQGFALLRRGSEKHSFDLDFETVARIWKGGCIIRSAFLEDIRRAYEGDADLPNILLNPEIAQRVMEAQEGLRVVVSEACLLGVPVPAFMATLGYLDSYRADWLPANLIQAQRDYFGSHCYERVDSKGTFHTEWEEASR